MIFWLQTKLHFLLQRIILCIPKISEMRLAVDKTMCFLRAWHYLYRAKISGDYFEFGVFEGVGFDLSLRAAHHFFNPKANNAPRFFAFDSFSGLPDPDKTRDGEVFYKGEYAAGIDKFKRGIKSSKKKWDIRIIPGFFSESLTTKLAQDHKIQSAAFVNIDCDLYPSTMDALRFVTPFLRTGTILYFDDWYFSGGDMSLGEPGACADWLIENPQISLVDFGDVAIMGKFFIVNLKSNAPFSIKTQNEK